MNFQWPDNLVMRFKPTHAIWVAAALLVAFGTYAWMIRGKPVDMVLVTQGPMVQSVVTSGRIDSVARVDITSQTTARIESILVNEGDVVQAGAVLVRLRDDEAVANLEAAQAIATEAQARLRQLDAVQLPVTIQLLKQAQAAAVHADQELARAQHLLAQGFISQSRVDEIQRQAHTARAQVLSADAQAQANRVGGTESAAAHARVAQALAGVSAAAKRLDNLALRAPVAATVISRRADPGDTAQPTRVLLTLVSGSETRIQAGVDEKNLKYIRLGQSARASADAYPNQPFSATLTTIAPAVDALRGTIDLKLRVDPVPDFLRPDMTVSVEIITAQVPDALMLTTDAVRRDANGTPFVLAARDGHAVRADVTLGLQGVGSTQILTGLNRDDRVILPTTNALAGERVRQANALLARGNAQPIPGLTQ